MNCIKKIISTYETCASACWGREACPFVQAHPPGVTRRDFLTRILPLSASVEPGAGVNRPPRECLRPVNILERLGDAPVNIFTDALENLQFTGIKVSKGCTACGACERACCCSALRIARGRAGEFKLLFYPGNCINCGLCKTVCQPGAMDLYPLVVSPDLGALEPVVLISGELRTCLRCGAGFLPKDDGKRCPPCEFRSKNPFGSIHIT